MQAIAKHRDYDRAEEYRDEAMITAAGDLLATWLLEEHDSEEEAGEAMRRHPVFPDLNIYPWDVETLLGQREHVAAHVESMTL